MLDATSYSFRIEIGGKINVKSSAVEVLNSGMFFEIGGKIPDFTVGGARARMVGDQQSASVAVHTCTQVSSK